MSDTDFLIVGAVIVVAGLITYFSHVEREGQKKLKDEEEDWFI